MLEMKEKVQAYKEVQRKIEELEEQKKILAAEILELMPKDSPTVQLDEYRVKRTTRLSIRISLWKMQSRLELLKWKKSLTGRPLKSCSSKAIPFLMSLKLPTFRFMRILIEKRKKLLDSKRCWTNL